MREFRPTALIAWLCLARILTASTFAQAEGPAPSPAVSPEPLYTPVRVGPKLYQKEESAIPQAPSAPPQLATRKAVIFFHCNRSFIYKGKTYNCDSDVQKDGERLRPLLSDTPAAISELNTYQSNRRSAKTAAYIGSLGLAAALAGYFISRGYANPDGSPTPESLVIRNITIIGGLGLSAGSFIYALSSLQMNQSHLGSAVSIFNSAHPQNPIELEFSTGITF